MATLTWQDVAGQVRAPDYSESAEMITQGLGQISAAVQAPERLRQERLDREMKGLMIQSDMVERTGNMIDKIDTKQKNEVKEKDLKEFSKNQSYLEAGVRKAALKGVSLDEYLATDKVYQGMGEGARSFSAANLSDAYMRGDETRITMEARAQDDAYRAQRDNVQDSQWRAGHALSQENARVSRANSQMIAAERRDAKKAADSLKPKVWNTGNAKTDRAMQMLAKRSGSQYNIAAGESYAESTIGDVGKGYKNLGAVSNIFDNINRNRAAKNQPAIPDNVLKRILDTNVGANGYFMGTNGIDDAAITDTLSIAADQYDNAVKGREYYEYLSAHVEGGARPDETAVSENWNTMFPSQKARPVAKKAAAPTSMDVYMTGRR